MAQWLTYPQKGAVIPLSDYRHRRGELEGRLHPLDDTKSSSVGPFMHMGRKPR